MTPAPMSDRPEPDESLQNLVERLLVTRVRASGFPTATSVVCSMGDPTDWGRVDLALDEVHDATGLVAHAAHKRDRSAEVGEALDRLARAMQLELSQLFDVANLELGQSEDDPYWGPVEICFRPDGIEYLLPEWEGPTETDDEGDEHATTPSSPPPTQQEVAALEAVVLERVRLAEVATAEQVRQLTEVIIDHLGTAEPEGIARVEVEVDVQEGGSPSLCIDGVYDADGNELEPAWEANDIAGLEDYVEITETSGSLTIDVIAGTIS